VKLKNYASNPGHKFYFKTNLSGEENRTEILLNGKQFIDKCLNKRYNTKMYKIDVKPKISVIIPVYNSEKTIYSAICSVQTQNFTDFEIILIDDFSSDNSSCVIQQLKENDNRIKIIRNQKNMGSLYSRSVGIIMAKGEYIFALDNDDLFFSEDIFYYILKIAEGYNCDIVGFSAFRIGNYGDSIEKMIDLYNYNNHPFNIIIQQPQLSTWLINIKGHYIPHDVTIWAKCIKSKIYKEATNKLGIKRYSIFVSWAEDAVINFIIFNLAQSFIFIRKYGIVHLHNASTASFSLGKSTRLFGEIFFVNVLYDFLKNNSDKNYAALHVYFIKRHYRIKKFVNNTNLVHLKSLLYKLLNDRYISNYYKKKIKKDFNTFFI
jgi:glycosyltransferase involved in cell wall biosynthesis